MNKNRKIFLLFNVLTLIICLGLFTSCQINIKRPETKADGATSKNIRNGIQFEAKGVVVEQAFLTDEAGALVDENNLVEVNKKLKLNLLVKGWENKDGQVALDANEKVVTSEGDVILDEKDLFSQSGLTSVSAEDARNIKLSVSVNMVSKLYDFYNVDFKVWNKNFDQNVVGSYKFNLK